jgi:hypothetical protein
VTNKIHQLKFDCIRKRIAMPNPEQRLTERKRSVANMMASLRIENLSPSENLQVSIQDYLDGKKTTIDLLNEVRAKYATFSK